MDETTLWIVEIVGPALLLVVLVWLVMRNRASGDSASVRGTEDSTRDLYAREDERRRQGTDDL